MHHLFSSADGIVEVTLTKERDVFALEGHRCSLDARGRLVVEMRDGSNAIGRAAKIGDTWLIHLNGHTLRWDKVEPGSSASDDGGGLVAPMPGKVLEVLVSEGQKVSSGDALMVLEAMKMEHRIVAANDGNVVAVHFAAGDQVVQGATLLEIEEIN